MLTVVRFNSIIINLLSIKILNLNYVKYQFFSFSLFLCYLIDYLIKNNYLGYKFQNYYNRIIKMPIFIILFLIILFY